MRPIDPLTSVEILHSAAVRFARCYTRLTEALMQEGVPEDVARHEARMAALTAVLWDIDGEGGEPWEE